MSVRTRVGETPPAEQEFPYMGSIPKITFPGIGGFSTFPE
jgi:hypothetical protein